MNIKTIASKALTVLTIVASIFTIWDFSVNHFIHKNNSSGISATVDEPIQSETNNRTFIGNLWHNAFSDEGESVGERWDKRKERSYEIDGVFKRIGFILFYFPIGGIIILLLSSISSAIVADFLLDDDFYRSVNGVPALLLGFVFSLTVILGFYSFIVWFPF